MVLNKNYSDVPIGKPLKGVKVYVKTDKSTNNTGELYLRGEQIMLGYVNFKNTYQIIKGKKYYPTGDIVKLNKLKEFEYIGRTKEYIKLDGFRINLGRIENIILKHIKISAKTTIIDSKIVLFIEGELNDSSIVIGKILYEKLNINLYESVSLITIDQANKINVDNYTISAYFKQIS